MLPVEQPFKVYTDLHGKPLDSGYVYIGEPNKNPITHPVTVYWDAEGTIPAAQPLRTLNGYIMRGGTPANVFYDGEYSELVETKNHVQIFYAKSSNEFSIATAMQRFLNDIESANGAGKIGYAPAVPGAVTGSVGRKLGEVLSLGDFGAVGDNTEITKNNDAWQKAEEYVNSFDTSTFAPVSIFIPDGIYKYSRTPTFKRPVRIYSNGGATLNYVGNDEVIVMGDKAQTSAMPGTNDYHEIDNINFIGAANASYGLYFANWVLQPKVTNCRFLNFGGPDMYAVTFQGNNWSIDLNNNRYLTTDAAGFARHWCRCFGVSNTTTPGTVSAGQVVNGRHDGSNSRLNALNNWVRFGGDTPGIGYNVTGSKSRIVGGGVENPSVGVNIDGRGNPVFAAEVACYFETPYGYAAIQGQGVVSGLNIHGCYCNLQHLGTYASTARFFRSDGDPASVVTSMSIRDCSILNATKYPLVTLRDAPNQYGNNFAGTIVTDAPLLGAMANHYLIGKLGYQSGYHNPDLLGGIDTSLTQITPAQQRISSRLRVSSGAPINASVSMVSSAGTGIPPCRNKHFALDWSSMLGAGNYIALEARMDDLGAVSGGIATAGVVARYVNSAGASSIEAVLQLATTVSGTTTVIASKNITITNNLQGFTLPQVVNAVEVLDNDFLAVNLLIVGAGHGGSSAIEILNIDAALGESPPPVMAVDRPRQVATANQWYRRINSSVSQAGAITSLPVQIGCGWATSTRNIKQISLAGAASASIVPFGESSVYVQPSPATGAFDIVFSVDAEN